MAPESKIAHLMMFCLSNWMVDRMEDAAYPYLLVMADWLSGFRLNWVGTFFGGKFRVEYRVLLL